MSVFVADTIKPMSSGEDKYPIVEGSDITLLKTTEDGQRVAAYLQTMYDNGELGGDGQTLPAPIAANNMLISTSTEWTQIAADTSNLANTANYQNATQVTSAITSQVPSWARNAVKPSYTLDEVSDGSTRKLSNYATISSLADVALSGDYDDLINKPTSLSAFDNTSTNYQNANQVQAAIAAAGNIHIEVVTELPVTGQNNILYLVPKSTSASQNVYDEYIWTTVVSVSQWEKIGSTEVDLSNYYTKTETNTQINGSVNSISYTNSTTVTANTVKLALDNLYDIVDDISASIEPSIKSFTMTASNTYEIGQSVNSITFSWDYNKDVTTQTLTDCSLADALVRTATYNTALSSTKTFTLSATDSHSSSVSKSLTVKFLHKIYYGSSTIPSTLSDSTITTLLLSLDGKTFKTSYSGTYPIDVESGEYGIWACPSEWNPPSKCYIGGFETEMSLIGTYNFTNASGNTSSFKVYRTPHMGYGSVSLVY